MCYLHQIIFDISYLWFMSLPSLTVIKPTCNGTFMISFVMHFFFTFFLCKENLLTHSLSHLRTHALTHSLTPSLPHSLTPSLPHSLPHSLTHSLPPSLSHSLTHSLTYWLTYSLTYLLTYLLTHLLTYSLTHLLTYSLTYLLRCAHQPSYLGPLSVTEKLEPPTEKSHTCL